MNTRGRAAAALVLVLLFSRLVGAQSQPPATPHAVRVRLEPPTQAAAFAPVLAADFGLALPGETLQHSVPAAARRAWWCSRCSEAAGARPPTEWDPPQRLIGAGLATTLATLGTAQQKPVVLATRDLVLAVSVPQTFVRDLRGAELAFARAWAATPRGDLDAHGSAHLWLWRMLRAQEQFVALLGLDGAVPAGALSSPARKLGHGERGEVFIFSDAEAYRSFGRHHFGSSGTHTSWWFHQAGRVCVAAQLVGADAAAVDAARFDHTMAHQCFFMYRQYLYHLPAWVSEGLGAWFERRHKGHGSTFCLLGGVQGWNTDVDPDWWTQVKLRVQQGKDEALVPFSQRTQLHELTPEMHPQAWALTAYLIGLGPARYRVFLDLLKKRREQESNPELLYRAVETAYGCDLISLQENWRTWVRTLRYKP